MLRPKAFTHFIHDLDDELGILFIHFKDEILEGGAAYPLEYLNKSQENLSNLEKKSGKVLVTSKDGHWMVKF